MHEEYQYLNLIDDILKNGSYEKTRNGNTYTRFGAMMRYSLKDNIIPILTTKKTAYKTCFKELFWFIKGDTDNHRLNEQKVHIWDGNSTKEFLKTRNITDYEEGDLGPIYGFQWRHFNAEYKGKNADYTDEGVDQLKTIIETLKNPEKRNSRQIILTAWNPCQIDKMALPPCHLLAQFQVLNNDELHCSLYQRSGDVGLGVPFNIASYGLLTHLIASVCNLKATELVHFIGNAHIYEDHVDALKEQIQRTPHEFPRIEITKKDNIDDYTIDDIKVIDYKCHSAIKMNMSA